MYHLICDLGFKNILLDFVAIVRVVELWCRCDTRNEDTGFIQLVKNYNLGGVQN